MVADGADTVQLLLNTGKELMGMEVKDFPNDPERKLILSGGKHAVLETPRQPAKRAHAVKTFADFATAFNEILSVDSDSAPLEPSPIWFDESGVVVFTNDRFRDESIGLALPVSDQLKTITAWKDKASYEQKALVRVLRHDLAGCAAESVLIAFRTLEWQSMINARNVVQQNKQSMDADIQQGIVGNDKPESFTITVPLFDHSDFRDAKFTLAATVDFDFDNKRIVVQLLPSELTRAKEAALELVRTRLDSALPKVTKIAGKP